MRNFKYSWLLLISSLPVRDEISKFCTALLKQYKKAIVPHFNFVTVANRVDEALPSIEKFRPHIAPVDIAMTPINGIELTTQICLAFPSLKVIGLSISRMRVYLKRLHGEEPRVMLQKTPQGKISLPLSVKLTLASTPGNYKLP